MEEGGGRREKREEEVACVCVVVGRDFLGLLATILAIPCIA